MRTLCRPATALTAPDGCPPAEGACLGGVVTSGLLYVKMKGVDSEKSYNYTDGRKNTGQKHCWKAGENRTVATIDNYTEVLAAKRRLMERLPRFQRTA